MRPAPSVLLSGSRFGILVVSLHFCLKVILRLHLRNLPDSVRFYPFAATTAGVLIPGAHSLFA